MQVSPKRVWRLMRTAGLRGHHPRAWKKTTTAGARPVDAPDLIGQDFTAEQPNTRWCGDITYVRTVEGWVYTATESDLAGLRDRALLLIGLFAAVRRGELSALTIDQITEHPNGLVLALPHSETNQHGLKAELLVLPRAGHPTRCPVATLHTWLTAAAITAGPVLRPISEGNRPFPRRLHPESINTATQLGL